MKRSLLSGLLLLWMGCAFPQIIGTVTDRQQKAIPYATVLVYEGEINGGTPKAYAITDNEGKFKISTAITKGNWTVVCCSATRSCGRSWIRRSTAKYLYWSRMSNP